MIAVILLRTTVASILTDGIMSSSIVIGLLIEMILLSLVLPAGYILPSSIVLSLFYFAVGWLLIKYGIFTAPTTADFTTPMAELQYVASVTALSSS